MHAEDKQSFSSSLARYLLQFFHIFLHLTVGMIGLLKFGFDSIDPVKRINDNNEQVRS